MELRRDLEQLPRVVIMLEQFSSAQVDYTLLPIKKDQQSINSSDRSPGQVSLRLRHKKGVSSTTAGDVWYALYRNVVRMNGDCPIYGQHASFRSGSNFAIRGLGCFRITLMRALNLETESIKEVFDRSWQDEGNNYKKAMRDLQRTHIWRNR
jgi:hypothetical protein